MFNLGNFQKESKTLYDKYSRFLENCHVTIGDGWFPVVDALCQKIENAYQALPLEEKTDAALNGAYKGCQIKEKFGGLRFYVDGETPEITRWIAEAEEACWKICENCGSPGNRDNSSHWIMVLCKGCSLQRKISKWRTAKDIDLQLLKDNHVRLYYFGLGFIQLKVDEVFRLHFYSPKLPPITEDIHNHRYDFYSRILKGSITSSQYSIANGSDFILSNESCNPEIEAPAERRFCNAALASQRTNVAGEAYRITHDEFHKVVAENCITLLSRSDYKKEFAQVVIKASDEPSVCPFSKQIPEKALWEIIEEMLDE